MESILDGITEYAKTLNQGESLCSNGAKRTSMRENAESKSLSALGRIYLIFILRAYETHWHILKTKIT